MNAQSTNSSTENSRGSALIIIMAVITFLALLALAFSRIMISHQMGSGSVAASERAFYIAEAGLEYGTRNHRESIHDGSGILQNNRLEGYWQFNGDPDRCDWTLDSSRRRNHGTLEPDYPSAAPTWAWNLQTAIAFGGGGFRVEYTDAGCLGTLLSTGAVDSGRRELALDNFNYGPLYFDATIAGTGDIRSYVHIPDDNSLDLRREGTLMAWIRMNSFRGYAGIIHKGDQRNWSDEAYGLQLYYGRRLRLFVAQSSSQYNWADSAAEIYDGSWYHVAGTWDRDRISLYINGALDTSVSNSYQARRTDGGLNIGAQLTERFNGTYQNFPFDGEIEEVRVYDQALSADEIRTYYNATR